MKKTTKIFGLLLTLFCLALVTGCTPITDTPDVPEEKTYTVTYSTEYVEAPKAITVPENTVLTADQLPELSTEDKTFSGWFDGETKAEVGKYKVTKDVTLTAKWGVNTYTVTFNTNGGNSVESKTVTYGGKVEKPADPTKVEIDTERYSFAYWYTSDKPDSAFDFNTEIKADITLYAKWNTTALYSITFVGTNCDVRANKTIRIAEGEIITLTLSDPDYEIEEISVNGEKITGNTFTMPNSNVEIYVKFKQKTNTTPEDTPVVSPENGDDENIDPESTTEETPEETPTNEEPTEEATEEPEVPFEEEPIEETEYYTVSYWYVNGNKLKGDFTEIDNILNLSPEANTFEYWESYFKRTLPIIYQDENGNWFIDQPEGIENVEWWSYSFVSLVIDGTNIKLTFK